ncbi:MAG TPA: hypothetical protein DEF34_01320 [Desulfotomaculum sp.]|nr:MAG: hypothetical protein JL56_13900 [Desulfotomaculum sp. BICA1-6]HBX22265.1 hypothetical protein [Desulfotomaculum sp.]
MKIGDIVTRKIDRAEASFCIIGFYTAQHTGEKVAILAMLDPNSVVEVSVQELAPVKLKEIIALTTSTCFMH